MQGLREIWNDGGSVLGGWLSIANGLTAEATADRVGVLGNIPVLFADYGIDNPSFGTISVEDDGLLEFVLVFERT